MGNSLGGKRSAKVMKINGETFKLKTPVQAATVLGKYPAHVLLDSEAVTHYGVRAKPLEPHHELKPKRLYFLVELPKSPAGNQSSAVRRVRSGIHMSAKDRLESLMLARRTASDLSMMRPVSIHELEKDKRVISQNGRSGSDGGVRVTVRLPRAEVERLMAQSKDGAEAAEKLVSRCIDGGAAAAEKTVHWGGDRELPHPAPTKSREKRVGFSPINEEETRFAVAS